MMLRGPHETGSHPEQRRWELVSCSSTRKLSMTFIQKSVKARLPENSST